MLDMRFARTGMGYGGVWDRGGIEISIDHLRRRSGELHGEIIVSSATARGHLHRASFNLSSTTARERLAKLLIERTPQNVRGTSYDWSPMLEEFCTAVLEAERRGAPVVKVGQLPPQEAEAYLVDPLLPVGKATIVYGAGGTGKSYLACLAAVCVATGEPMLGWRVRRGPVLYLDWETDHYEIDERVKRVAAGMGIDAPEIDYRSCAAPLEDMAEDLARRVAEDRIALVIVDSVGMASGTAREGGDANESALRLFSGIRYLGTSVLAVDHITGEDVKNEKAVAKPYGSIYKVNLARSVWELRRGHEDSEATHLGLFHRKVNKGSLQAPVGIRVDHEAQAVSFRREDITDDALAVALGPTARIIRLLSKGPMHVSDIADETGISQTVVRSTVNRGRQFVKVQDGRWAVSETAFRNGFGDRSETRFGGVSMAGETTGGTTYPPSGVSPGVHNASGLVA